MRKITFGGGCSLDNFIARPDGAVDWLMWGDEAAEITRNFWINVDTILMGRKTFEVALKSQGDSSGGEDDSGIRTCVFSRTRKFEVGPVLDGLGDQHILAAEDTVAAGIAQLHLFAGLSVEQAGTVMGLSRASAYRNWKYARAWLRIALED